MEEKEKTRGFLTLAAGDLHYYKIAANLLRSYRRHTKEPLPFAILADRENRYTAQFDQCILSDALTGCYLDKLQLAAQLPFGETIFLDADCLAYGDLNRMFDWFREADDVSCHGRVLPITDKTGWFDYENLGPLQRGVSYCVGLHGGLYFIRSTEKARAVFRTAGDLAAHYGDFHFRGNFQSPGDEPLVALAMALHGCRPIPFRREGIRCYWEQRQLPRRTGEAVLVHWGTRYTRRWRYRAEAARLKLGRRKQHGKGNLHHPQEPHL